MPARAIRTSIELEVEEGTVVMSGNAQIHAQRRHPNDFSRCLPHVASVIANPLYIGDDAKNPGKIELVARVPALGHGLLVAVNIELDGNGEYNIASFYPVSHDKIENRRAKNHLRSPK